MNNNQELPAYYKYWGKAKLDPSGEGSDYHLLAYHSLDVAAVGWLFLDPESRLNRDISVFLEIDPKQLQGIFTLCLALHDLGKFASAFQSLYSHSVDALIQPGCRKDYDGRYYRHDRMGLLFWNQIKQNCFAEQLLFNGSPRVDQIRIADTFSVFMECVLGHHGQPIDSSSPKSIKQFTDPDNGEAVSAFFEDICTLLSPVLPYEQFMCEKFKRKLELVSWQLAGVAVVADWVGSDQSYFKFVSKPTPLAQYWEHAVCTAKKALNATDLNAVPQVQRFCSIQQHYGFEPTPLQKWAETVDVDDSEQLFILEDITGAGKTEAALALTHRLMEAGAASGFYFGLPTMATSNAMFSRVAKHYRQMLTFDGRPPSIVLAHGAREMNDLFKETVLNSENPDSEYESNDLTATAQCNQWLADSRKKALLAPVGVGTIDQALLAVLPRRHQSLRLLGLNNKVLIFDEVHAADEYMFELLESLLALHLHQGGSAILLTATLSKKQRSRLTRIWQEAAGLTPQLLQKFDFPLATRVSLTAKETVLEQPLESRDDVSRSVAVVFIHAFERCIVEIVQAAQAGQCVVWVRNSVDDALEAFEAVSTALENSDDCLLFHSRFVLADRKAIEQKVLAIFGKTGDSSVRAGKVLIATQVFQESLDADADLMISDICPIDDLIQRAGRLHRHTRSENGGFKLGIKDSRPVPELILYAPEWTDSPQTDWLSKQFRNTQYVYRSPGRLWLGMRELKRLGAIQMPENARQLIEAAYGDNAYDEIPAPLLNQENTMLGEQRAKAAKAESQLIDWQQYGYCDRSAAGWYEDNTDISTRHSDIETVEILLLRKTEAGDVVPWIEDGTLSVALSKIKLSKNKYADKLASIPIELEQAVERFRNKNKQAKYLQCWLPGFDVNFTYESTTGFREFQKEDV
ncbi:CRISPR-associated helicase/endonuclease Cas3 [Teredinibacter haidensis]|uniref:CRISPR-associated helicase/endonuclease Cas3 n=1 Tax=Teredinibacter haidensis TaxID=2731755 RepID=UPI0009489AB5|nr:CRISPR-associated helicase/endonuclease Cas3 [Teredinibacter haidensis]